MKHDPKLLAIAIIALGLPVAARAASTLTQAQITQIIKDVQTIDPGKGARSAVLKETLQGEQAVRTGVDSRAELLFNDHTITRLGANTHFSFTEGTRNMSLQSGVMLLEVPKGIGGAKIETAAVTAAVTGTTIMVEAGKNYTKLIVLEGECCLWPKNDKNKNMLFKFKHKTCATQGQEIILRNGAKEIPDPVYVNLKVLEGTSLLITGDWNTQLNTTLLNNAANGQGPGTYVPTNLAIIGAGTDVTIIQGQEPPPPGGTTPPGGTPPPFTPPGKYGPLGTVPNSSNYTIGGGSTLNTDPKIINNGETAYGRIYRGTILDGPPVPYLFGAGTPVNFPGDQLQVDSDFPAYGVAAFKFTSLNIQGAPTIQMSGNGATYLALVSLGDITISNASPSILDFQLDQLLLGTAGGNIDIGPDITITGLDKLSLYSYGAADNITVDGDVTVDTKFYATTQGNYSQSGDITAANNVTVLAGGAIDENGTITAGGTSGEIDLEAQGSFGSSGSTGFVSAPTVNLGGGNLMTLNEVQGGEDIPNVDTVNNVQLDMNALQTLSITGNGIYVPNGFTGESFAEENAEDSPVVDLTLTSYDDGVTGSGTINLAGNISVDNLIATADSDITVNSSANIQSNSSIQLTSNNDDIEVDGQLTANNGSITLTAAGNVTISGSANLNGNSGTQITATNGSVDIEGSVYDNNFVTVNAGGNITTGSNAFVSGDDGTGPVTFTSTGGTNTVMIDGDISASTINITGYNVHTLSSEDGDGLYGNTSITINAANNVTLDGYLQTPTLTVTGIGNNGTVPANVTIPSTASINADNIYINAGNVEMEGFATEDENDFGSNIFSVNTTSGTTPLIYNSYYESYEDFYSVGGSAGTGIGEIDSGTVQITSRGDLILDNTYDFSEGDITPGVVKPLEIVYLGDPTVNGVDVNPYGDLYELDLTGSTIEVIYPYTNYGSTLNLTTTGGDITDYYSDINLGTGDGSEFSANSSGNIVFEGDNSITADSVTLTANQITTPISDPAVYSGNITINVSGVNVSLSQDSETASTFYFDEFSTDGPEVGNLTLDVSSSSNPSLSISANSLTVGNIDTGVESGSFDSFTLSFASANDINADSSATITAATSVALQVGVAATLAGDGDSNITYNGGQLTIDDTYLDYLSVTASSITVNEGFPTLENASLNLTASGANDDTGGITVNAPLNVPNGSITLTADSGNITVEDALNAGGGNLTLGASNGLISVSDALSSEGDTDITAYGGEIDLNDNSTVQTGGNLNIYAYSGNLNINSGSMSVGGNFTAYSLNNILINVFSGSVSVGGSLTLNAGGAIDVEDTVTINGALTLNAGGDIHSSNDSGAEIFGATGVTLVLNANTANMSETITGGTSTLYFGAVTEEEGYGPLAIDLTDVISNDSSITGTATSLTFSGGFDAPGVSLSLTASSGTLSVMGSGTVNANYFSAYSNDGDIVIGEPVTLQNDFYAYAYIGNVFINSAVSAVNFDAYAIDGNITINAPLTLDTFYADATNGNLVIDGSVAATSYATGIATAISGTGSITSTDITLQSSGTATLLQTGSITFAYNGTLTLDADAIEEPSINLTASPLVLDSAIAFGGNMTLAGVLNTQGYSISANNLTLQNLQTTTGASGNATNLTASGNSSVTLDNVTLNGANGTAGSGGTLTATGTAGEGGYVVIDDTVSANGGSAGGAGGTINITAANDINTGDGASLQANGGAGGGNGGSINLTAQNGTIYSLNISADGGSANPTGPTAGGNGGSISLTSGGDLDVEGNITANGGDANPNSGAAGGNGGTVTLDSDGSLSVDGNIEASSGVNGNTKWTGGNGGTVNLTAQGEISVTAAIEVSSSDLYTNRVSASGGTITVTSHATTGVAINIASTAQLASILNQAAPGPGGTITFLADSGGSIQVSGSLRADAGTINIQNTVGSGTAVAINGGATLSADVVKVGVLGPGGELMIGNGGGSTFINGDTLIELYSASDTGSVVFAGPTFLTGAGLKTIAGSTVTIISGVVVTVNGGAATVYTNTAHYNGSGGLGGSYGHFSGNATVTTQPFGNFHPQ